MSAHVLVAVLLLALASPTGAIDVPVAGRRLTLRAGSGPAGRAATLVVRDAAIAAPLPDPTLGASLIVAGGAAAGQCHAEVTLEPGRWEPIGGNGAQRGYRYRADGPATQGVRRIILKPGTLVVTVRGGGWPCNLSANMQRVPVDVELRAGGTRYCSAFGGTIRRNRPGRFKATGAPAPAACPETDLTVANLNILHGLFCPAGTANCRRADRTDLLFQWVVDAGCPDVVTLQEVSDQALPLLRSHLAATCPFPYQETYFRKFGVDDQMILTRHPVVASELVTLYKGFRTVTWARLDHPIGPVDVFSTHLASGSDGAQNPCGADCPPDCVTAGAATVRQCQGVQLANLIDGRHDVPAPAIATGDFNESPGTFVYDQLANRGWIDSYLAAGNPECNPLTGVGCTSGRQDEVLTDLESSASNQTERIDYIFVVPPAAGSVCTATLDPITDTDGDGTTTRIFADDPNPFAPTCGPLPDPICWPSDHEGAELDLNCL